MLMVNTNLVNVHNLLTDSAASSQLPERPWCSFFLEDLESSDWGRLIKPLILWRKKANFFKTSGQSWAKTSQKRPTLAFSDSASSLLSPTQKYRKLGSYFSQYWPNSSALGASESEVAGAAAAGCSMKPSVVTLPRSGPLLSFTEVLSQSGLSLSVYNCLTIKHWRQ